MSKLPTVIFSYKKEDLLEEVYKRTSYFGKNRFDENNPHLLDRLSLTSGEDFLFDEFLEDAMSETYNWLKAFGRNIDNALSMLSKYEDVLLYKDHGLHAQIGSKSIAVGVETAVPVTSHASDSTITVQSEPINMSAKAGVNYKIIAKYIIYTYLDGLKCSETKARGIISTLSKDSTNTHALSFTISDFEWEESGSTHEFYDVELYIKVEAISPTNVEPINAGSYVEYHTDFSNDSIFDVYQVNAKCTTDDWMPYAKKLDFDPRGNVVFVLERTDVFDINMVNVIDRNIKEALVNYIIHRWYEYTNVSEAEIFYLKYEEYAHKAQIGMNSETKMLQKPYKYF